MTYEAGRIISVTEGMNRPLQIAFRFHIHIEIRLASYLL